MKVVPPKDLENTVNHSIWYFSQQSKQHALITSTHYTKYVILCHLLFGITQCYIYLMCISY
jgi:hypothetical protein